MAPKKPDIRRIDKKVLVGKRLTMSMANNLTGELWRSFMPLKHSINHRANDDMISLQNYDLDFFTQFNPTKRFEKWAGVEVTEVLDLQDGMENMTIPEGLYAVFHYKGSSADPSIFQYILGEWLPQSEYELDNRPHFEVLGPRYKNNDPNSEEDIYIPIRLKE